MMRCISHLEFKRRAREHQVRFRTEELKVGYHTYPNVLTQGDARRGLIFYEEFREAILTHLSQPVPVTSSAPSGQMLTNLLRSEHIPYNIFFPMNGDKEGCRALFNEIIGGSIAVVEDIVIEFHPEPIEEYLEDHTAFDVYVSYIDTDGSRCGIGIEVKYTEKEYPLKNGSSEYRHIKDENGRTRLFANYLNATDRSGYYNAKATHDILIANKFRQIWRNHILGAAMVLHGDIAHFISITLYPEANGHFHNDALPHYAELLSDYGRRSFVALTYERLFYLMECCFTTEQAIRWIDYLRRRYLFDY